MLLVILQHLLWQPNQQTTASSLEFLFSTWTAEKEVSFSFGLLLLSKRSCFSMLTELESGWQCAETGHLSGGHWRKCNTPSNAPAAPCAQNIAYIALTDLYTYTYTLAHIWTREHALLAVSWSFSLKHTHTERLRASTLSTVALVHHMHPWVGCISFGWVNCFSFGDVTFHVGWGIAPSEVCIKLV